MSTFIQEGGQGSERINDVALHTFPNNPIGQVEILEDGTDFVTVSMQTKNPTTLQWSVGAQIAGTGTAPTFDTGHQKGEYITGVFDHQRFTAIRLNAGSIRVYFV